MTINTSEIGSSHRSVFAVLAWGASARVGPAAYASGASMGSQTMEHREAANGNDSAGFSIPADLLDMQPQRPLGGKRKRLLDMVIASTALLLASPVMLAIAILIRLTMGGPAIFSHRRIGFNGRPFNCYKFRTMVANADEVLNDYLSRNPEAAAEWEETRKLRHDPRITLLGQILRKSSLDELPQFFNVLRGDMSCVGPRPIVVDELKRYGALAGDYLQTRPGLTGLWQVTGRSAVDYSRRVWLDSHYVRNWSIWADLVILAWTVFAVMRFDETS
jgi:exopolysaccharide production protein ExoY